MKRSLALLLSVLMIVCCIPSTLMTVLAVDPAFKPNGIRNQTFDDAYNQYIPETVTVDGVLDDTAWAYEDWNKVTTETGTWNKDIEEIGVDVYKYNYQYQFKTDYEYFYGAIKLNQQFYGDFVIWLNDGRWEYCTDRIVINPTKIDIYGDEGNSAYTAGATLKQAKLRDAVKLERNISSVLDHENSLGGHTQLYERNGAGAYIPAMKNPAAAYQPNITTSLGATTDGIYSGSNTDWVSLWEDLDGYSYEAEKTQYVIKKNDDGSIVIEFRIYAYAFENGKIEQDGTLQEEDYNPNYTYYVSAGVGSDAAYYNNVGYYAKKETWNDIQTENSDGTLIRTNGDKVETTNYIKIGDVYYKSKTKTYYSDTNGTKAGGRNGNATFCEFYVYTDCYYTDDGTNYRAALYYPRLSVDDDTNRDYYIPGINQWPKWSKTTPIGSLGGLKPEIMEMTDVPDNDSDGDSQMVVDGVFTEDIWSPLTNYHVNGDQTTNLDLSRVKYSITDATETYTGDKQSAFKLEIRYDDGDTEGNLSDDWLYGAAIAYNAGGTIQPTLTLKFHLSGSNIAAETTQLFDQVLLTIGSETVSDNTLSVTDGFKYNVTGTTTTKMSASDEDDTDFWAIRKKNTSTGLWQYEFKIKVDGNIPLKDDGARLLVNASLDTGAATAKEKGCKNSTLKDYNDSGVGNDYYSYYVKLNQYDNTKAALECNIENVIFDGKVDAYDWAALCAFDNKVSGMFQDDYVYVVGSAAKDSGGNTNADGATGGGNPDGYEGKINTTNGRDLASYYKLTSDGEYLYGGVLVQFGEGTEDYWHTAKRPGGYSNISDADDYENKLLNSGEDIDLYRIWINNNPEHTNSLEREGATSVINIAIIKSDYAYEAYLFVGSNCDDSNIRADALARIPEDKIIYGTNANNEKVIKGFALEFRVSLYAIDLKHTQDNGVFMSGGYNVLGTYDIAYSGEYYYNDRENSQYYLYYVDLIIDSTGLPESAVYEKFYNPNNPDFTNGNLGYGTPETIRYKDGTVTYDIVKAYEWETYPDVDVDDQFKNNQRHDGEALSGDLKYHFEEFNYTDYNKSTPYYNHVDYTNNDKYFCYYVTIENAQDTAILDDAPYSSTPQEVTVSYGRLISVHTEDPLAVDAWTGHVYATYQNGNEVHWWRRNFFNVHIAHNFGYNDMLDYCIVDGKLEEHMWHRAEDDHRNMTFVTPTTGVWETTPTQNEVFEYTYRVWTDGNYIYGGAWLNKEIVKGKDENDNENCTKLELYFKNNGHLYYFDMYFRDDDEIVGTYQIDGDSDNATITGGLTDMLYQKTITYANKECYFEFRIDLSKIGCEYTHTGLQANTNYYLNRVGISADGYATGGLVWADSNYDSKYNYSGIEYHIGMTQPCQTGAAYEVLTLFADSTRVQTTIGDRTNNVGDPYEMSRDANGKIVWGTLNQAIRDVKLDADYTTATMPSILKWDASDAMRVDQMEHFAGEKIRVDGTLNDTGWAEHRWLDVDRKVNGSEDVIFDDLSALNYKYMVRSDGDYLYVSAVIDVEFTESTKPEFYFWILNGNTVDYIKLAYGKTTGVAGNYTPIGRDFDNSELYDVYDVDDIVSVYNGGASTYHKDGFESTDLVVRDNVYTSSYVNGLKPYYYETADKTFTFDPKTNTMSFNTVKIETSSKVTENGVVKSYGIDAGAAGLYGYSEVVQEMNSYFDVVNHGQVVGKQHALMQSANGVMINDNAGKKTETVVEFRVLKSAIDIDGNGVFQYAVQASATFNGQVYDLVYPYVDNKVGENREMDDYNFPNSDTIEVWQENAITVNSATYERYNLRNNTNSVVTLGAKANITNEGYDSATGTFKNADGDGKNNAIRFGSMYTENYIRNNVYAHTVVTGDDLTKDGYTDGKSNVQIDTHYNTSTAEKDSAGGDLTNTKEYHYWDTTKLGNIILPTWMLGQGDKLNYYSNPSLAYVPATSIVTWKGDYSVGRNINFADYESFQYYTSIPDIPDEYTWIKYSFAAINGFDYVDKTKEADIGDGEHKVHHTTDGITYVRYGDESYGKIEVDGVTYQSGLNTLPTDVEFDYQGMGVTVNYYYDQTLERSPLMINYITKGTEEDGDDSSNEESALPENMDEGDYNGTKVAYIPLDNRPVNVERVKYLAEASGFELIMPEEDFYRTATYDQKANSNKTKYGDQNEILTWLREIEDSENVDYYVISLDQVFFGGLGEAASATGREQDEAGADIANCTEAQLTARDLEIIEYLGDLADGNYVYYYTSVTPTVGLEGYAKDNSNATWWADSTFRNEVAAFTEVAHQSVEIDSTNLVDTRDIDQTVDISGASIAYTLNKDAANEELDKVFANYFLDGNNNPITLETSASIARKYQILNTRVIKMRLITEMLATIDYGAIEHFVFGVDDERATVDTTAPTIQDNEIAYIKACIDALNSAAKGKENYQFVYGIDQLGLAGISAITTDLYASQKEYFTNGDKVVNGSGTSLLWENGTVEGVDVKVEYIKDGSLATAQADAYFVSGDSYAPTYTYSPSDEVYNGVTYDELITEMIEAAGGRRVKDKSSTHANATLILLVMLPAKDPNTTYLQMKNMYQNFVSRAIAQLNAEVPTAMVAFGHYGGVTNIMNGSLAGACYSSSNTIVNPGRFMGTYSYSRGEGRDFRNTAAHAVGVSISNAISRYSYLTGKRQTVESHEGEYKVIGYSLVNDLSYNTKGSIDMEYNGSTDVTATKINSSFMRYNDVPLYTSHFTSIIDETSNNYNIATHYFAQSIVEIVNRTEITVMINPDFQAERKAITDAADDGDDTTTTDAEAKAKTEAAKIVASRHQNMADIMVGNAVNPLDRPHELTFDVAVVQNDADNVARNKDENGIYIRNRNEGNGAYFIDYYKYYYEEVLDLDANSSGKYVVPAHTTVGVPSNMTIGLPAGADAGDEDSPYYTINGDDWYLYAKDSSYGKYTDKDGNIQTYVPGALNYVTSVTNNYYADNESESVINYRFSYGAELTDGIYTETLAHTVEYDRNKDNDEDGYPDGDIPANTNKSGFSNNQWFAFNINHNCHYAGNGKYFGYVVVDLKDNVDIGAVRLHMLNNKPATASAPTEVRLLTSIDGTHFTYVDSFHIQDEDDYNSFIGYWSMLDAKGIRGRYVKIEVTLGSYYALLNEIEVYPQDTQTIRVGTYNLAGGKTAQANAISSGDVADPGNFADTATYFKNFQAVTKKSIEYFANDIMEADLDVVFLQEISLNADGYLATNGFGQRNMIQQIADAAGFKYVYLNRASWRTDVTEYNLRDAYYANDTETGYDFNKVSGSAILSKYPMNADAAVNSDYICIYEGKGIGSGATTIMDEYITTIPEHTTPIKNYDIIMLDVPANGSTMQVPVFSAHCNPQNLEANILPHLKDASTGNFYDNLIVAGDFNNPTFTPLIKHFPGMNLTVNDTNKLITYYQGKSMDNIIYSGDDYSLVDSGTIQSGNSDHYLLWAELEYYEWID